MGAGVVGVVLFLLVGPPAASAETVIGGGVLTSDTLWDGAGEPFIIGGDIEVAPTVTLTVGGGTRVQFTGNWSILVNGTIIVSSPLNDTDFELASNATSADWRGIRILAGGTAIVEGASLNGAFNGVECDGCAALQVTNLVVSGSANGAVIVRNTTGASIMGLRVVNSTWGLVLSGVFDSTFDNVSASNVSLVGIDVQRSDLLAFSDLYVNALWAFRSSVTSNVTLVGALFETLMGARVWSFTTNWTVADVRLSGVQFSALDLFDVANASLSNVTVDPGATYGIGLQDCKNISIVGLQTSDVDNAVSTDAGSFISVTDSTIVGGDIGVVGYNDLYLRIINNTFLETNGSAINFRGVRLSVVAANNLIGASPAYSENGGANAWDENGVGNFWYPHNYTDTNSDLIGDSPYLVGGGLESDLYPRMLAFTQTLPWCALTAPSAVPQDLEFQVQYGGGDFLGHEAYALAVTGNGSARFENGTSAFVRLHSVGVQSLTLTVTNLGGRVASVTAQVLVLDTEAPRAALAGPASVPTGGTAVFDPGNTTDNDPSFPAGVVVNWSITDPFGNSATFSAPFGTIVYSPTAVGTYAIRCTMGDASGNSNSSSLFLVATDSTPPLLTPIGGRTVVEDVPFALGPPDVFDDDLTINATGSFSWRLARRGIPELTSADRVGVLTFNEPGRYNGSLTVCDASGRCSVTAFQLAVTDTTPPDLLGLGNLRVNASHSSLIDATGATDNDPEWPVGGAFTWAIDVPTGTLTLSGFFVLVLLPAPGTYHGTLSAADAAGNRATAAIEIVSLDVDGPEILASVPPVVELGESITFSAGNSFDPSAPLTANWEFGDGSPDAQGLAVLHTFSAIANLIVRVTLQDAAGNANSSTFAVRVIDTLAPSLEILAPGPSGGVAHATVGVPVNFEVRVQDSSGAVSVTWAFGDGQDVGGSTTNHTYYRSGTMRVRVTATDGSGNINEREFDLVVEGPRNETAVPAWAWAVLVSAAAVAVLGAVWWKRRRDRQGQ